MKDAPDHRCPVCDQPISAEKFDQLQPPTRIGRPTKPAPAGERIPIGLRVTSEMKTRLDTVAQQSGRSFSQEVELRLERSLEREDLLPQVLSLAYGRKMAGLFMMLGYVMRIAASLRFEAGRFVRRPVPDDWLESPEAFAQVAQSTIAVLNAFPSANTSANRGMNFVHRTVNRHGFAWRIALDVVHGVSGRDRRGSKNAIIGASDAEAIRSLLGPIASRLHVSIPTMPTKPTRLPKSTLRISETEGLAVADAILSLINASPRTPSREEIARAVRQIKVESGS
jgi:hypothetical protein